MSLLPLEQARTDTSNAGETCNCDNKTIQKNCFENSEYISRPGTPFWSSENDWQTPQNQRNLAITTTKVFRTNAWKILNTFWRPGTNFAAWETTECYLCRSNSHKQSPQMLWKLATATTKVFRKNALKIMNTFRGLERHIWKSENDWQTSQNLWNLAITTTKVFRKSALNIRNALRSLERDFWGSKNRLQVVVLVLVLEQVVIVVVVAAMNFGDAV